MSNEYFNASGYPAPRAAGVSASLRAELASIAAAFDKLPAMTGNGGKVLVVNASGNALETAATISATAIGTPTPASGAFTTLSTTGAATLSSLSVTSSSTLASLGVTGAVTVGTTLGVTGASTLASLSVTGAATVGTTLGVTGATTLAALTAGATTLASGTVTGALTVGTTLGVTGAVTLGSTLNVTGAVSAPSFSGPLTGNASTATSAATLTTARTIAISGDATGTATSFNGSANISIPITGLNASGLDSGTVPDARITGAYSGVTTLTVTSGLLPPAGTAATPSIRFSDDTNTGIYRSAVDTLAISTGGSQRLTVSTAAVVTTLSFTSTIGVHGPDGRCAEIYSGTSSVLTDYPVGTILLAARDGASAIARNGAVTPKYDDSDTTRVTIGGTGTTLSGTWRARGGTTDLLLVQRIA